MRSCQYGLAAVRRQSSLPHGVDKIHHARRRIDIGLGRGQQCVSRDSLDIQDGAAAIFQTPDRAVDEGSPPAMGRCPNEHVPLKKAVHVFGQGARRHLRAIWRNGEVGHVGIHIAEPVDRLTQIFSNGYFPGRSRLGSRCGHVEVRSNVAVDILHALDQEMSNLADAKPRVDDEEEQNHVPNRPEAELRYGK